MPKPDKPVPPVDLPEGVEIGKPDPDFETLDGPPPGPPPPPPPPPPSPNEVGG